MSSRISIGNIAFNSGYISIFTKIARIMYSMLFSEKNANWRNNMYTRRRRNALFCVPFSFDCGWRGLRSDGPGSPIAEAEVAHPVGWAGKAHGKAAQEWS